MTTVAQSNTRPSGEKSLLRHWAPILLIHVILGVIAFIMLFPFLYMFFTSLKQPTDVYTSPPRLFPYSAEQVEYNGAMTDVYRIEVDGVIYDMILDPATSSTTQFGWFTTADQIDAKSPEASRGLIRVPLDETTDTGHTLTVGEREFDVYQVTIGGVVEELPLAYKRGLSRFISPNDPTIVAYEAKRTAPLSEFIDPQWKNYNTVLELRNLDRALVNTIVVTIGVTVGQVVTSIIGGYAFSRMQFRGRNAIFMVYLGTIMIPFVVLIIPLFQLMTIIGWRGHLVSLILPWIFTAYGTFLMRQFFITIPKELEEAAFLDGLNRWGILWRIFVPLSGPAIATQAIITFLYAWNSFLWPLVVIGDSNVDNHVVTLTLNQLRNAVSSEPNLALTGAAVAILPPLLVFIFAQRYFIEGIASTGLKG